MFKKSKLSTVPTLFTGLSQQIGEKKIKVLEDPEAWQNRFYDVITSRIDESIFKELYCDGNGRPNAPIRQLIGMQILKEANDWTDEQLFESCSFNILVMRALGLNNLSDNLPSPATYYNFNLANLNHEQDTGINLIDVAFTKLSTDQVLRFNINGSAIRMDSKLIQSNIAKMTRLQLALSVVIKFYKSFVSGMEQVLSKAEQKELELICSKLPEQHTYRLTKESSHKYLEKLGELIQKLIEKYSGLETEEYLLLNRFFEEHFEVDKQDNQSPPKPRTMKGQGGNTLQSPHDPEATYRNKPGTKPQKVAGFISNITDTCYEGEDKEEAKNHLSLITSVQTEPVTYSDDKFFIEAVNRSEEVLNSKIKSVLTDGAFSSYENEQKLNDQADKGEKIKWYHTGMQGAEGHYDFEQISEDKYKVTDKRTGLEQITKKTAGGKFRITEHEDVKAKYRYFKLKTIMNYFRRKAKETYPKWVFGQRANGESTIHQVFCKLDGHKTRYRGLHRNHCYVLARCFWVNFKRIMVKTKNTSHECIYFLNLIIQTWIVLVNYRIRIIGDVRN